MIKNGSTDLGKTVRMLREIKGMGRSELAEAAGISESHLKKIEIGIRKPGIDTYQRIIEVLEADIVIKSGVGGSLKESCVVKAQEILMGCTEPQALYLVNVLEFSAGTISSVAKSR